MNILSWGWWRNFVAHVEVRYEYALPRCEAWCTFYRSDLCAECKGNLRR